MSQRYDWLKPFKDGRASVDDVSRSRSRQLEANVKMSLFGMRLW